MTGRNLGEKGSGEEGRQGVRGWPCKGTAHLELHDGSNFGWLREHNVEE